VRGTIEAVDAPNLTIRSRTGETVKVRLADNARVTSFVKANVTDLKPNTYVGVTSVPAAEGGEKAVSVHIFPEERRGTAEGRAAWDLLPDSKMTTGAVNVGQVEGVQGQVLTVTYKGQEATIRLTPETPIVAYTAGDKSELKPGVKIMIFSATRGEDGTLQAAAITYGRDGLTPPM
jgi:ribosomal protein S12